MKPHHAVIRPIAAITPAQRDTLYALLSSTYRGVERARFEADFDAKDHVILLRDDRTRALVGFSTLGLIRLTVDGQVHRGVFSGDTVLDRAYWGGSALGRAFLRYLFLQRARHPRQPLWWFLISKGYKTYLMMANNFPEHWPRFEAPTPPAVRRLMDAFGQARFPGSYHPDRGILRFDPPRESLREGLAPVADPLLATPRIAYFAARNPGWAQGEELVCLAPLPWTLPLRYALKKLRFSR